MIVNDKLKEPQAKSDVSHAKETNGCGNCDWLWGNGKNYCPYCRNQIRV